MNAKVLVTPVVVILLLSVLVAGLASVPAAAQSNTLGKALDNQNLSWSTGGTITTYAFYGGYYSTQAANTSGWYSENSVWHSGGSAAESYVYAYAGGLHEGVLSDQAYLKTVVNGPGILGFYWKLNASTSTCNISFYVDGKLSKVLSINPTAANPSEWTQVTVSIGPGQHTITWTATALPSAGYTTVACAYVDTVTWTGLHGPLRLPVVTLIGPLDQQHP